MNIYGPRNTRSYYLAELTSIVRDTSTVSNPLWYLTINDRIQETLFHIIWRSLPVLSEIHLQYRIHFGI